MATSGRLAAIISDATGVALPTVRKFTHTLHVAGLLTTGARGVNAPAMTPRDAAYILIAMLLTDKPADAVRAIEDVRRLNFSNPATPVLTTKSIFAVDEVSIRTGKGHDPRNFFDTVVYILTALAKADLGTEETSAAVKITFNNQDFGFQIETNAVVLHYRIAEHWATVVPDLSEKGNEALRRFTAIRGSYRNSKMGISRSWYFETLYAVAKTFAED